MNADGGVASRPPRIDGGDRPDGREDIPANVIAGSLASADGRAEKWLVTISLGIVIGYVVVLANLFAHHGWIEDAGGRPGLTDFIEVWSAGSLALSGSAAAAYDGAMQHAAEVATLGHGFDGEYGWPYPPSFLFVAETLARLPYLWGFALLLSASLSLYGLSIAAITRRFAGMIVAFAAPWTLGCALVGQNGFLTAGLFALVLLNVEKRPAMSGLLLGLLTYKPQFGLLIPLALAMSGRWRVIGWAAASTAILTGLSVEAFGMGALIGFIHALPRTSQALITDGAVGWGKLQSAYGLMRCLGASDLVGWVVQGVVTASCAVAVALVWRSRTAGDLKAASLALAAIVATPYVFAYDLPLLGVAAAFVYRHRRFDRADYIALAVAALAFAPFAFVTFPFGLVADAAVAVLIGRRLAGDLTRSPRSAAMPVIA